MTAIVVPEATADNGKLDPRLRQGAEIRLAGDAERTVRSR
jgi:hypothetical protein